MNRKTLLVAVCLLTATTMGVAEEVAKEKVSPDPKQTAPGTKKSVRKLQEDFLKLKFGMFIHYNMATYKGVQWVAGYPDPSTFNPGSKVDTPSPSSSTTPAMSTPRVYGTRGVPGIHRELRNMRS